MFLYTTKNVRLTLCHNRAGVKPYVHFLMYIRMYICMYVCTKVTSQKLYKACFLHHVYVRLENERALLSKLYSGLATPPRLHPPWPCNHWPLSRSPLAVTHERRP